MFHITGGLEWEEISKLGRGRFGEVFLWKHRKSGETKAVKRVRYGQDGTAVPDEVKQLQREIDILKILKHPNIVEYFDNDIINSYLVILMEFVPGGVGPWSDRKEGGPYRKTGF